MSDLVKYHVWRCYIQKQLKNSVEEEREKKLFDDIIQNHCIIDKDEFLNQK